MVVFGTRPEAIKMAPLCHKLLSHNSFKTLICVTAQHREMLDQVLDIFELSPDIDLNIMQKEQDLTHLTSIILLKVRDVLSEFKPDLVFVHGDTTTSFVTSLACFYAGIKLPMLRQASEQMTFMHLFQKNIIEEQQEFWLITILHLLIRANKIS